MNTAAVSALTTGTMTGLRPYDMLVDANGSTIQRGITVTKRVSDSLVKLGYMPWTYSPVDELNYNNTILTKTAVRVNTSITGKITNWLNLQLSGQLQRNIEDQVNLQDLNSFYTRDLVNTGTTITSGKLTNNFVKGGVYKTSNIKSEDYSGRAQLNFNKSWGGGKNQLTALAGTEIRQVSGTGYKQTRYGYDPSTSTSIGINPGVPYATIYGSTATYGYSDNVVYQTRQRYLSYMSNASYSYLGKYHATASARFDDASMVGVRRSQRGKPLYSVGLRWDLSKENFMKPYRWLNNLDIRSSLGTQGTIPQGATSFTVISLSNDSYTGVPISSVNSFANPTLTWQIDKVTDVGFDAAVLNNRLTVTFDYFNKKSNNVFFVFNVNPTYGFSTANENAASMTNHGYELTISGDIIKSKNWRFNSSFNISHNANKITDSRFPPGATSSATTIQYRTGMPADGLYVYRYAGLDAKGQPQVYNSKGTVLSSANFTSTYAADMVYAGRSTPSTFGGFSNTVQYKSWSLSTRMTYSLGYKLLKNNLPAGSYPSGSISFSTLATTKDLLNRWRKPGDEAFTNVPGVQYSNSNSVNWYNSSDINVIDGGQIRLQQVTLAYMMPAYMLKKLSAFKAAQVSLTASNLGIIWRKNKDGIDPNYVMTNSYNNLPPAVNYSVNFNLTF